MKKTGKNEQTTNIMILCQHNLLATEIYFHGITIFAGV
jgi:hypothetical protein